jgi:3-hydroxyisobutyrate dehydrogenase-like beta-hydroxyacid dehydrogenase
VARLTSLGALAAKSAREVASRTETVMASLPSPEASLAVATGKDGVIEGTRVRSFLDLSTTGARMAARIAEALAAREIVQIDCPVSGGPGGAEGHARSHGVGPARGDRAGEAGACGFRKGICDRRAAGHGADHEARQ